MTCFDYRVWVKVMNFKKKLYIWSLPHYGEQQIQVVVFDPSQAKHKGHHNAESLTRQRHGHCLLCDWFIGGFVCL